MFLIFVGLAHGQGLEQPDAADMDLPEVLEARVSSTPDRARLVIDLTTETEFALVSLDDPDRIAVDVRASQLDISDTPAPAGEGLVADYRLEQAASNRVRTVLDLAEPAQVQQAYVLGVFDDQPARLVVDIIPATPEVFAANVARDRERADDSPVPTVATEPGGSNITTTTRPLVVIDPGHGGIDSGAESDDGVKEKDIVLDFAKRLQEILLDSGRFDVALTRGDDTYLRLEQRVALARQNRADLFISIHADSFQQPEIRGASVYTRDENATDVLDKVLADQENKSDLIVGLVPQQRMPAQVVDILVDLMRREIRVQSFLAAEAIVNQLEPSVELRRFPLRQADFFVLQAPDIPSVLIELGFLSNDADAANLMQGDWRDRTAEAIARGISSYFDNAHATATAEATD